jgi:quinoprotein glucose dehydrogenase
VRAAATARVAVILVAVLAPAVMLHAQQGALGGAWPSYGGDAGSTKYAPLGQINADNVDQLQVAWRWTTSDAAVLANNDLGVGGFKATPIMVHGVLFVRTSLSIVAAIVAATGEQLWEFDPKSWEEGHPTNLGFNTRGVAHWSDGEAEHILVATGDAHLWAVDAWTGRPVNSFGTDGRIDLTEGLRRAVPRQSYQVISPPLVVGDVVIVGSSISDGPRYMTAPPGDIRAFDVRSGEEVWRFNTVPEKDEYGIETWEDDSWTYTGNTNVWSIMSADLDLEIVYLPIGTPTNDWYGGHRLGNNLFAESLVAVDAVTGERVWHYQLVHHGLWDYDIPAAPTLVDITVDGRPIRAVAQVTKQGFVYVFDRVTGEPVWPIEERPVPQSTVPGERVSPTQPFPTKPRAFEPQGVTIDDLFDFTPELRAKAEAILSEFDYGPLFTPPSERGTINMPGWGGGANWQGAAFDPETGYFYVPSRTSPMVVQLAEADPERSDFRYSRGEGQGLTGPQGLPLFKPPYARVTAYDLNSGERVWMVPHGDGIRQRLIDLGIPDPGPVGGGGFTGPLLTPNLLFLGHSGARCAGQPPVLRAFDKETGTVVHATALPVTPSGTPMTYMAEGRQFIVMAYGSGEESGLIGLALPTSP